MLHQQYGLGKNIEQKFLQIFMMECLHFLDLRINILQNISYLHSTLDIKFFFKSKKKKKKLFVFFLVLEISKLKIICQK